MRSSTIGLGIIVDVVDINNSHSRHYSVNPTLTIPMLAVLINTWPLLLGIFLLLLGNSLQGTLLGVRGAIEHMDTATLGFIMSAYFVGFLGGSKATPLLLKRVGHVRVFAAYGSLVSAAFILYAAIVNPVAWWALRLMVGFCFSGIYVVAESWLNNSASNENRGQALSLYLMVQSIGMVSGQALLNFGDPAGYDLFIMITVLVSLSFAPILLSDTKAPSFDTATPMSIRELVQNSPLASVSTFLLGGIYASLYAMAPVYASAVGFTVSQVAMFTMAIFLGGFLFQFPIGWISDRMDRRLLIIAITGIATVTAVVGSFLGESWNAQLVIAVMLGGAANPLYSLIVAYANDYLTPEQMPAAAGGMLFLNGLGAMGSPILLGYLMQNLGNHWFYVFIAVMLALICAYGLYRMTQRRAPRVEDTTPLVPITIRSTAVVGEMAVEESLAEAEQQAEDQ